METIEKVLTSMGYRQMRSNIWGKPVGFHLFMYEIYEKRFRNYFYGVDKLSKIYNSETYKPNDKISEDFLNFLKIVESNTTIRFQNESSFEFNNNWFEDL